MIEGASDEATQSARYPIPRFGTVRGGGGDDAAHRVRRDLQHRLGVLRRRRDPRRDQRGGLSRCAPPSSPSSSSPSWSRRSSCSTRRPAASSSAPAPRRSARPTASTSAASSARSRRRSSATPRSGSSRRSERTSPTSRSATGCSCPGRPSAAHCFYCAEGRPDQCSELFDAKAYFHVAFRQDGAPVSAAGNVGGYAEMMNVTANQAFPLHTDLPDDVLSLLGCGITSGVGAVFNVAEVKPGRSVAILGMRAPRAVDGAGRAAGRGGADHRGRADRLAARDGGPAAAPPTSSTPPTATRSSRCARSPAGAAPTTSSRPRG